MDQKSPDRSNRDREDNLQRKKEEQKANLPKVEPNQRSSNRKTNGSDGTTGPARGSNH